MIEEEFDVRELRYCNYRRRDYRAAVAYHLAKKNCGKIAVVEKDQYLGNCSTAKCAGGIRAQFSSEVNVDVAVVGGQV